MNSKNKFYFFLVFFFFSVFVTLFSGYFGVTFDSFEYLFSTNSFFSAFLFIFLFILLTSFSFSVSVMTSFGTILFAWYFVVLYAMIGIMGSSSIDFYISRKLGKNYIQRYLDKRGGKIEKLEDIIEKDTFRTILVLSAIFFVPPTLPNFLGGIININFKKYFVATFLGNLPNTFFTVYLIHGIFYSNNLQIYSSIFGLVVTTLVALFFYSGEITDILHLSFPWLFRKK